MDSTHELIIPHANFPFKLFEFEGKDGNYHRSKHWHRSLEILAVFEGDLVFYIDDTAYPLKAGDFILVNSNEIHHITAPHLNTALVLQMPLSLFQNYFTDEQFISFSHFSKIQDLELMALIGELYTVYQKKDLGYEFKVQSLFFDIVYQLITKYQTLEVNPATKLESKGLSKLSLIAAYMKENSRSDLTLESTAEHFGYTATHLSKMFRKYAKTTYRSYLESVRVSKAYEELMNSDYTIGEIASRNGFPNSNAFSRSFKARYGMLPSEFKRSHELGLERKTNI